MDFEAIDELLGKVKGLQDEQQVFVDRVEKLKEKKDTVTEQVFQKIMGDYKHKLDQLNTELYPLYDQLKLRKAELNTEIEAIEDELKAYMAEKEEITVRCELGEFTDNQAKKKLEKLEAENEDKFEALNKFKEYKEKVSETLSSEYNADAVPEFAAEDLSEDVPEIPDAYEDDETPEPMDDEDEGTAEIHVDSTKPDELVPPPPPPDESQVDKTVLDMEAVDEQGSTVLFRPPTLTVKVGPDSGTEYRLKMGVTNIGSDKDNDIVLKGKDVAKRHAQVTFGPDGFTIFDYNPPEGISVNGKVVSEHLMQDGDLVKIGAVELNFTK